jgi:hypothetical protein
MFDCSALPTSPIVARQACVYVADFSGRQTKLGVGAVLGDETNGGTG